MSDSGTSDTGDSQAVSDTGESSVFSDWSVVDEHGDLPDDDTTSTTSSVEIVEEDDPNTSQSTPIAGSPSGGVAPRFILRLPSHVQVSDTDDDQMEDNSSGKSSGRSDSTELVSKSASCISAQQAASVASVAPVSQGELDELRKTLDTIKRNLHPSHADDSSLSSFEMFGDGKSDKNCVKTEDDLAPQSFGTVEDIGNLGNMNGNLSLESSVSSSYSFLSRDAGTECSLLRERSDSKDKDDNEGDQPGQHEDHLSKPLIGNLQQGTSQTDGQNEELGRLGTTIKDSAAANAQGTSLTDFVSLFMGYHVKYIFLAGLVAYTAVLIFAVLYIKGPGPVHKGIDAMLNKCLQNNQNLNTKLEFYINAFYENDITIRRKDEELTVSQAEKEDISAKLLEKERDILVLQKQIHALLDEKTVYKTTEAKKFKEIQIELQNENERLHKALEVSSDMCEQKIEECKAHGDSVLQLDVKAKEDEKQQAAKDLDGVKRQCQLDLDKVNTQCQEDVDKVKSQCQMDLDTVKGQLQFDVDNVKSQCHMDVDKVKSQCQMDLNKIRNQCQSDSLEIKAEAENKYATGQCGKSKKPVTVEETKEAEVEDETETNGARSNQEKVPVDTPSESRKGTENRSKSRDKSKESSGRSSRSGKKAGDDQPHNKGDYSNEYSGKGHHSTFNWADTVMELMNKTKEQIQDTWTKVKDMSETLWQEHQPALLRLQDSLSRKFQHISKKFQGKLARKMNKWFRKFKGHEQQEDSGPKANTKRRQHKSDEEVSSSNRTIEERLVKLSHQVEALNAKKFKKWREFPKVLDIEREFEQVNSLVKTGQNEKDQQLKMKNKLSNEFSRWYDCQFSWWENPDVVTVTDDCYLALCCWQVKVTGGDVKECRKTKRKQGIVEDTCTLELIPQPLTPGRVKTDDNQYMNTKAKTQKKKKFQPSQSNSNAQGHKDGTSNQEPVGSDEGNWFLEIGEDRSYHREEPDDWFFRHKNRKVAEEEPAGKEDNWYIEMGEEREYHHQEPDDWFFRRKNKKVPEHKKSRYSMQDEDFDDDDDDYYWNDE